MTQNNLDERPESDGDQPDFSTFAGVSRAYARTMRAALARVAVAARADD